MWLETTGIVSNRISPAEHEGSVSARGDAADSDPLAVNNAAGGDDAAEVPCLSLASCSTLPAPPSPPQALPSVGASPTTKERSADR